MSLPTVTPRRALNPLVLFVLTVPFLAAFCPAPLEAQQACTLSSPPVSFEPNPPGATRPISLYSGKQFDLQLFQAGGSNHMLMMEAFGYSVLDLSNPTQPAAIVYDDMRVSGEMPAGGDGQSYVASMGVSADGQRVAFSLNGNASPEYGSIVGSGSGGTFGRMTGGFLPRSGSGGTAIQNVANRYLAYVLLSGGLFVVDVTNPPSTLSATNMTSESVGSTGGFNLALAGNNVLFIANGTIHVINASNPGPIGNIQSGFQYTSIGSGDVGGGTPTSFSAALDPSDASKLWVLVETSSPLAYALVSVRGGVKSAVGSPFLIPTSGGTWVGGGVSALVASGNNLFALMWAKQNSPSVLYRLYSNSVAAWGVVTPGQFDVDPATYPLFALKSTMRGLAGSGNALYAYVPTSNSAFVLPMSCVSSNAPAVASMAVTAQGGASLSDGATVFLGDTISIAPVVNPPPSLQPLTGFGWNFDFDFHASEDNGAGASPRLRAPDNASLGSPSNPPALITVVGPCDPQVAGTTPASGTGCWASVKGNAAFAGGTADFPGSEGPGASKPLKFAFEAKNVLGSAGASTFTLNWTVPTVRLKAARILSGGALDATASDGHPAASGYKWYFGDAPPLTLSSCSTATCVPTGQAATTGPHYYWVTVPYSQIGYTTQDCLPAPSSCTSSLSYTVTDFVPAFTVNGSATGPVTALTGQPLTVSNSSQRGATVTGAGGYWYSLCAVPCADNYVLWGTMGDPPPSGSPPMAATIPNPGVGTWLLKIRVNYVNPSGTAYWPDPTGATPITVHVTSCSNPDFHLSDGSFPNPGFSVQAHTLVTFVPNIAYATYSWDFGDGSPIDTSQSPSHAYSFAGNYTVTFIANGSCTISHPMAVTSPPSLSASASANPNPASVGATISFTCSASGGSGGGYSYNWSNAVSGSGQSISQSFGSAGTYQARCDVTDSASNAAGAVVNFTVQGGGGGGCTTADFHITVGGVGSFPSPGFSVATGDVVTFIPNNTYSSSSWSFGDGASDSTQVPTHTYSSPGTYTVSLTTNGNCTRSYQIVVTGTGGGPSASGCNTVDFSILDGSTGLASCGPFGCSGISGAALSFVPNPAMSVAFTSWNFGDGTTSTTASTTHTYAGGGTFTITLTAGTCTKTKDISISGPLALAGTFTAKYLDNSPFLATQVASGKAMSFLATDTADTYTWDFGDGTSPVTGQTPTHTYFTPGSTTFTYTATLSVTRGTGTSAQNASTTQSFTILPPPEPPKWVVPGMAYLNGQLPGTLWQSDVTIFNPDPTRAATISVAFLDGNHPVDDPALLTWHDKIVVPPLGLVASRNVLGDIFGQPLEAKAYGALMIRGDVAPAVPVVTARTFNAGDPTKGTFGLSVPPTPVSGGVTSQAPPAASILIGLGQNADAYTNLGLVNLKDDWPKIQLDFLDGLTVAPLASKVVDMKPYQALQINDALLDAGYAGTSDLYTVKVKILQGTAVYPYATVIDARSTAPIVVTPTELPSNAYRMPGLVRLNGANGERWRSRFTISNPSLTARSVHVKYSYVPCDASGCKNHVTIEGDLSMSAGQSLWANDFVAVWLMNNAGIAVSDTTSYQSSFLDVTPATGDPNQEPLVVLGETYNDTPNGHIGLQIPGYTPLDGASHTGAYKRLALTGLASTTTYRTNLALFVVAGATGKWVNVHVYSSQGTKLRDVPVYVDGLSQVQDATLFGGLPGDLSRLSIVVDNIDDGVTVGGYATIIDNKSGAATFVKAQPAP